MDELDNETKRRLHRLMAGGRLSRPEIDAIREGVLDEVERREGKGTVTGKEQRPGRVIRYAGWGGAVLAAAAAVLLFVEVPSDPGGDEKLVVESGDVRPRAVLEVRCSGGKLTACPKSSEIVFALSGRGAHGFLSAYAEPVGQKGDRVFYFSKEEGSAELAVGAEGTRVAKRAVRISGEQRPGRYRVHAFFAARPLGREEMRRGPGPGVLATRVEVAIVE